jgi:hypothetical protein
MLRQIIHGGLIAGLLVMGMTPPGHADKRDPEAEGRVFTIVAIDTKTDTATLRTEDGQTVQTIASASWKAGNKVECDVINRAEGLELQKCQPWGSQ